MGGGWVLDDIQELALAVLEMAVHDYQENHGVHYHTAKQFLFSQRRDWMERRELWQQVAFYQNDKDFME